MPSPSYLVGLKQTINMIGNASIKTDAVANYTEIDTRETTLINADSGFSNAEEEVRLKVADVDAKQTALDSQIASTAYVNAMNDYNVSKAAYESAKADFEAKKAIFDLEKSSVANLKEQLADAKALLRTTQQYAKTVAATRKAAFDTLEDEVSTYISDVFTLFTVAGESIENTVENRLLSFKLPNFSVDV